MKHSRHGAVASLLALSFSLPVLAQEQVPAAPNKPGFFRQLGTSLKDAGQQAIGVKSSPTNRAPPGRSNGLGAAYTPLSGAGKLPNLFRADNHQQAQLGKLDWPRVALTIQEWGASLPCWTIEARIWTSPTASTTESFRTCSDAPLTETDDLGDTAELNTSALWKGRDTLTGIRVPAGKPNTGAGRSTGPNPPSQPFVVNVSRPGVSDRAVEVALRVAWVSGFIQTTALHPGPSGILTPFRDGRMWIAGFQPDGNRDR